MNLFFERTQDPVLIREVLTHPRIYDAISDDGCPPRQDFTAELPSHFWTIAVLDGEEFLGLFLFEPRNSVEWIVHTCLLPHAWGTKAKQAAQGIIPWIFANTPCRRITTHVPKYNRLALRFARQAGLTEYGVNPSSWLKHQVLHDQILLGISKE